MTSGIRRMARRSRSRRVSTGLQTVPLRGGWNDHKTALCSDSRLKHLYWDWMLHALLCMQPAK